uniref:Uncharacterized protein n=1 Tax=Oryza barthii TaxID=65489 RepID=A0A0D3FSJ0_9ORYZ
MAGHWHSARGDDTIYPWQCHGRILREIESTNGFYRSSNEAGNTRSSRRIRWHLERRRAAAGATAGEGKSMARLCGSS